MSELECIPLGIGQNGEGVCLDLRLGQYHFLLDCGLKDLSALEALSKHRTWSGVFCSHAHADHCRGILKLQTLISDLRIFTTEVTAHLLPFTISIPISPLKFEEIIEIEPNLFIKLLPAGHLPGAASIWLTYVGDREYNVLYTGDFFSSNSRLVQGLRMEQFRGSSLDVLIIEGSFGTIKHPHRRTQEHNFIQQIEKAIASGYSVLFPVPKVGIGQEILTLLRSHHAFTGKDLDIWIDAGIGEGCDLYMELLSHLPLSVQNFSRHQSLFWDDRISPRIQPIELIDDSLSPCIILVDIDTDWIHHPNLGMHAYQIFLPDRAIELKKELIARNYPFVTYLLAEHCDVAGTTQLIHNLKPQHVVFMHGDSNYLADLASLEELSSKYHIHCPAIGIPLDLPLGDSFDSLQGSSSHQLLPYAGDLAELNSAIMLTLPIEVTNDSRWFNFSDTGLIEAKWQGEDLLIRGITQRELLNTQSGESDMACQSCRFYINQRCLNRSSPLSGLKVSSDGYCLGFEKIPQEY